jgi:hypothetical protein
VFGFDLIGWNWSWKPSPVEVSFQTNVASFPNNLGTDAEIEAALVTGLSVWGTDGEAPFAFTHAGNTTAGNVFGDNTRRVRYANTTATGGTLAVAQSSGFGNQMRDCDITIYAANAYGNIPWSVNPQGARWYEIDLAYVALHEFGHCAGLDHSGDNSAVMAASAPSGTSASDRTLGNDDRLGLQAMYGVAVGADLELTALDPLVAGTSVRMQVSGADPGERVHLIVSTTGVGGGACPAPLNGGCLDLNAPVSRIDFGDASNQGVVDYQVAIPAGWSNYDLGFQAVARRGSTISDISLSNTIDANQTTPPSVQCPSGEALDCAGTCYDATWPGDGYCDDGTTYNWGSPDFNCATYNFDEGDCGP